MKISKEEGKERELSDIKVPGIYTTRTPPIIRREGNSLADLSLGFKELPSLRMIGGVLVV